MESGPIQYKEYLEFSKHFKKRVCVDLSATALDAAKKKIGDHGEFLHGSFFDIPLEENSFDCAVSLHTIYHIDKARQEEAVRKLIYVTRPGKPVIIVYSNPDTFTKALKSPFILLRSAMRALKNFAQKGDKGEDASLYFDPYAIDWWDRFTDVAAVKILPWRSFSSEDQKRLMPNNKLGRKMFAVLFKFEERYSDFFVKHFEYPMIVLTKK